VARRLRDSGRPDTVPSLHARLRDYYAARAARYADRGRTHGHARHVVDALDRGDPVVLAGWELARYHLPQVRRGVHAFYQVGTDGRVVEVVARRDPNDPDSIVAWEEV